MPDQYLPLAVGGACLLLLFALVLMRAVSGGRFDVKLGDIVIAAIPLVVWLMITGQLSGFSVGPGGVSVDLADAIRTSAARQVGQQTRPLPVTEIATAERDSIEKLRKAVGDRIPALELTLGANKYQAPLLKTFLEDLTRYEFFRFVVLSEANGKLFGLMGGPQLAALLQGGGDDLWKRFTDLINRGDRGRLRSLLGAAGLVMAGDAVRQTDSTQTALGRLQEGNRDWLPVVQDGTLVGVVERDRLVASLILDASRAVSTTN